MLQTPNEADYKGFLKLYPPEQTKGNEEILGNDIEDPEAHLRKIYENDEEANQREEDLANEEFDDEESVDFEA
jgi:hypothetical protein